MFVTYTVSGFFFLKKKSKQYIEPLKMVQRSEQGQSEQDWSKKNKNGAEYNFENNVQNCE